MDYATSPERLPSRSAHKYVLENSETPSPGEIDYYLKIDINSEMVLSRLINHEVLDLNSCVTTPDAPDVTLRCNYEYLYKKTM